MFESIFVTAVSENSDLVEANPCSSIGEYTTEENVLQSTSPKVLQAFLASDDLHKHRIR